ncbi:MAG: PAN domain-containing protein [Alphaproteobacteria bacterium]
MSLSKRNFLVSAGAVLLLSALPALGLAEIAKPSMEANVSRWGSDYRRFALDKGGAEECAAACAQDSKCQAWSYVKAGASGTASAICRLKSAVPKAASDPCCVSGVMASAAATGAATADAVVDKKATVASAMAKTSPSSGVTGSIKKRKPAGVTTAAAKPSGEILQMPLAAETPEALTSIGAPLDMPEPTPSE